MVVLRRCVGMRAVAKVGGDGNRCTRRGGVVGAMARARTMEYDSVKKSVAYGMSGRLR